MGAPMLEKVVRVRFSHGAAPAHCGHSLQSPTTKKQHRAVVVSPHIAASGQACGRGRGGVVGCFLHTSTVYFFAVGNHSTARNNVERSL